MIEREKDGGRLNEGEREKGDRKRGRKIGGGGIE